MSYDRASKQTEITILNRLSNNENIYQKYKVLKWFFNDLAKKK